MSQENLADNNVEQQVQNILDLGSVPMENFRTLILKNLNDLQGFILGNRRKILMVSLTAGLGLLAAACEAPHTLQETNPQLHAEFVLSDYDQAQAAQQANQGQHEQSNQVASNVERAKHYLPEAYPEFWYVETTVGPGEGILAALERKAGATPERMTNIPVGYVEVIIVYHDGAPTDMPPEVLDWDDLQNDPRVWPGDRVKHTLITEEGLNRLRWEYPSLIESLN